MYREIALYGCCAFAFIIVVLLFICIFYIRNKRKNEYLDLYFLLNKDARKIPPYKYLKDYFSSWYNLKTAEEKIEERKKEKEKQIKNRCFAYKYENTIYEIFAFEYKNSCHYKNSDTATGLKKNIVIEKISELENVNLAIAQHLYDLFVKHELLYQWDYNDSVCLGKALSKYNRGYCHVISAEDLDIDKWLEQQKVHLLIFYKDNELCNLFKEKLFNEGYKYNCKLINLNYYTAIESELIDEFEIEETPTTLLISKENKVLKKWVGVEEVGTILKTLRSGAYELEEFKEENINNKEENNPTWKDVIVVILPMIISYSYYFFDGIKYLKAINSTNIIIKILSLLGMLIYWIIMFLSNIFASLFFIFFPLTIIGVVDKIKYKPITKEIKESDNYISIIKVALIVSVIVEFVLLYYCFGYLIPKPWLFLSHTF